MRTFPGSVSIVHFNCILHANMRAFVCFLFVTLLCLCSQEHAAMICKDASSYKNDCDFTLRWHRRWMRYVAHQNENAVRWESVLVPFDVLHFQISSYAISLHSTLLSTTRDAEEESEVCPWARLRLIKNSDCARRERCRFKSLKHHQSWKVSSHLLPSFHRTQPATGTDETQYVSCTINFLWSPSSSAPLLSIKKMIIDFLSVQEARDIRSSSCNKLPCRVRKKVHLRGFEAERQKREDMQSERGRDPWYLLFEDDEG